MIPPKKNRVNRKTTKRLQKMPRHDILKENTKGGNSMIYLDYAASAPPYPQVAEKVRQVMIDAYGNPGAIHQAGNHARWILHESRRCLARLLNVREQEVFFTSGGTEANNWAVKLGCRNGDRRHIVVAATEHKSVLEAVRQMETQGYTVTRLQPDKDGRITPEAVDAALTANTALLCVQAVNNETGVIQDVEAIAALAKKKGVRYLCDAVQSFGHVEQPLHKADFISISAHKLGGPRGVGCLVVRYPHRLPPLIHGGGQELGHRSGTENLPGIAGFALAAQLSMDSLKEEEVRLQSLTDTLLEKLKEAVPTLEVNGGNHRHPGILNCHFPGITAEEMVARLDLKGICASPGAACAASDPKPSHVLLAMGYPEQRAKESVRFSVGRLTTTDEIDATAQAVASITKNIK